MKYQIIIIVPESVESDLRGAQVKLSGKNARENLTQICTALSSINVGHTALFLTSFDEGVSIDIYSRTEGFQRVLGFGVPCLCTWHVKELNDE